MCYCKGSKRLLICMPNYWPCNRCPSSFVTISRLISYLPCWNLLFCPSKILCNIKTSSNFNHIYQIYKHLRGAPHLIKMPTKVRKPRMIYDPNCSINYVTTKFTFLFNIVVYYKRKLVRHSLFLLWGKVCSISLDFELRNGHLPLNLIYVYTLISREKACPVSLLDTVYKKYHNRWNHWPLQTPYLKLQQKQNKTRVTH